MGVKYRRDYSAIIGELSSALEHIEGVHDFFEMNTDDWKALSSEERMDCIRTLSDDVIYVLGRQTTASVGSGFVEYDEKQHMIKVIDGPKITIISLI
ncbi:MAG TPA: hypothetical protein GX505_04580 [Clostridiales bacterium]|nr:hypothetical protein [Clostridiales bacterium]